MSKMILQINFKLNVSRDEYEQAANALAAEFAKIPGLGWKVWLMNEATSEAGGIYFFEDEPSMKAYLDGPLVAAVGSHPAISDMSVKPFEVMPDVTAVTRGPI